MLFNSYGFIFVFLPLTLGGFFLIAKRGHGLAALWLAMASLFFYSWWNPRFVVLLVLSILFNFAAGQAIGRARSRPEVRLASLLLALAIAADLAVLAYFKYANFFIQTVNNAGAHWGSLDVILPLGISFFTFTQIAFLVDVRRGIAREYNFIHYLLFVTYFPHLIAGPVLHHKQMMPQFSLKATYTIQPDNLAIGLTIFTLGLFKKVVLADQLALYANPIFDLVAGGASPKFAEAWAASLAFALQLYFDFSGYSDMAIGLARLFNVKLPLNFSSPYKAVNMIEFWRRWHMTLSAFLRDYLYFPLGGNRKGEVRRYVNLMITMLLGGLWHGAGWTFVLWGALHGIFLSLNHGWRHFMGEAAHVPRYLRTPTKVLSTAFTFCLVTVAWVPFRMPDVPSAWRMVWAMAGGNGISVMHSLQAFMGRFTGGFVSFDGLFPLSKPSIADVLGWILLGLVIVWALPNTQEWMAGAGPAWAPAGSGSRYPWRPTQRVAIMLGLMLAISIIGITRVSRFLYFQF